MAYNLSIGDGWLMNGWLMKRLGWFGVLVLGMVSVAAAQTTATQNPPAAGAIPAGAVAKTAPVSRTTKAVHYRQGGSVKTAFQATELLTGASGEAKVEAKKTSVTI